MDKKKNDELPVLRFETIQDLEVYLEALEILGVTGLYGVNID